ncbi:squamosa promoter-binding 2 [Chlorella sorokiniana]|uniref:Squamosa promoter-binding 2 n=1 Tax=Chlorella sorokiniana TaxID=3076 RepID=A0A2P6TQM3_CHLSO|nr:squamosa promoter-binding 2 [Chlorella sorokiniana]|eukprot:PRW56339.1 squamosa promoter-binding 2 [Chlorella sorokiniana]
MSAASHQCNDNDGPPMSDSGDWAASDWAVDAARLAPARRRRRYNPDACQVEGCTAALDARFHKRHHICAEHLRAPRVAIDGRDMRFCQKCAKFEALEEFDGSKRTCQRALAAHNLARQRRKAARKQSGAAQQQQQAMAPMPTPGLLPLLPYVSPGTVHRISLKVFGCAPHELGASIRAELEGMLHVSAEAVEAAIRPGCVHLTADLLLGPKSGAAAATVSAAQLLAAVRCHSALGAAAGNAALLQWQGGVAGTQGGAATEAEALAAAGMPGDDAEAAVGSDSDGGSDSDSDAAERADSRGPLELPWSSSSSEEGERAGGAADTAGVWVRPVGLQPGRCELEVQLPLSGFAAVGGSATCKPVLLSSATPLLVLPCAAAAAAAEVRAFLVRLNGQSEALHVGDLLRDVGTAVGFLWRQQQEQQQAQRGDDWQGSEGVLLPPHFVAAAAGAAADYVQLAGGMPRLLALLQRAAAAAAAVSEGAQLAAAQAAELGQALPSLEAAAVASEKASGPGRGSSSGPSSSRQQPAAAAAGRRSLFESDDDDEESNQHCTPAEQLELEAATWGPLAQQARRMPGARWARWAAAIAASFLALLIVRLVLLVAPGHGM